MAYDTILSPRVRSGLTREWGWVNLGQERRDLGHDTEPRASSGMTRDWGWVNWGQQRRDP